MRKLIYAALISAVLLSLGCAITNYPVIFDDRGPWGDSVLHGQYDKALIEPSGMVGTIYSDGSDMLFSTVTQDWKADQWIYTYNNFDPTASVIFLDNTYCDPNHQTECWVTLAWNPDLPDAYPHGDEMGGPGLNPVDDIFDYAFDTGCSGARSLSVLVSYNVRIGECGSGIWASPQDLALEFSLLNPTTFRGLAAYELPIDASIASFTVNGVEMPIYGRFTGYIDTELRLALPMTPNWDYQASWLNRHVENYGSYLQVDMTYGSLNAQFHLNATSAGF
jgi:hypothetical protein